MSKTPPPPPAEPELPPAQAGQPQGNGPMEYRTKYVDEALPGFAEAWISIALGAILLFVYPNTLKFVSSPRSFDAANPITDVSGNSIPYSHSAFLWSDMGVAVFALVLIAEGIVLATAKRPPLVLTTMVLTIGAAVFNLIVVVAVNHLIGFQIICALAVAVGGYMAATQWRLVQVLRQREMMGKN